MLCKSFVRGTIVALLTLLPAPAWAQSGGVAGVVRDTTGAVMPGVTVEAASPALIERVRTSVTDGQGQYKLLELRPGIYTVTFTLAGFNTIRRDGLEVSAGGTVNLPAEMRVGALEETVMVTGATPMVDIQNVVQHRVVTRDVIENLPSGRNVTSFIALVPGVSIYSGSTAPTGQDVGGSVGERSVVVGVHGSRGEDMPLLLDGMKFNLVQGPGGGAFTNFLSNTASVEEIVVDVGGHSSESMVSGVRANIIPRSGGNVLKAFILADYTHHKLQWNNIGPDLEARGVGAGQSGLDHLYDFNPAVGGPILKDKLWFFYAFRHFGTYEKAAGAFYNRDPLAFVYPGPDRSRPGPLLDYLGTLNNLRLTWQANERNKFNLAANHQMHCANHLGLSSTVSPEASRIRCPKPLFLSQLSWNAPVTNKLLFDVGGTLYTQGNAYYLQEGTLPTTTAAQELSTGLTYRSATAGHAVARTLSINSKAIMSYVTGSHAFKVGLQMQTGRSRAQSAVNNDMVLQFLNGVPRQVQIFTTPYETTTNLKMDLGVFAQDQWTIKRLTMNMGVRFDHLNAYVPAQDYAAARFVEARSFPAVTDVPNWKDVTTRIGGSYDLLGNGKTAIKASIGKYLGQELLTLASASNPAVASINNTTRPWTDLNGNFFPDCDMRNPDPNGECQGLQNRNFGKLNPNATVYDPDYLRGWGKRGYNWEAQAGIQHELTPNLSVTGTYTRHWNGNFLVQDNLAVSPSDYSTFCVTAPVDARLPGGGGNQICGFTDLNPNKFGQVQNFVTFADNYGSMSEVYNGLDVSVNARLPRGITVQGGTSVGRTVYDQCDVVAKVDNPAGATFVSASTPLFGNISNLPSPSTLYCRVAPPLHPHLKVLGVVPLPWMGLTVSATLQSVAANIGVHGNEIVAAHTVTSAQVQNLGRNLSAGTSTTQLIEPGTMFGDRLNQLDVRLTKSFSMGRMRLRGNLDLYNMLNVSTVMTHNRTYGAAWLRPTYVLPGRFFKLGGQLDF